MSKRRKKKRSELRNLLEFAGVVVGSWVLRIMPPRVASRRVFAAVRGVPLGEELLRLTRAYTCVLEDWIRKYPDQWLWPHRRWKGSAVTPDSRQAVRSSYTPSDPLSA